MKIYKLVYILMPVSVILAFVWAPSAEILGNASRILYFHVPIAWASVLAFMFSGITSIVFLLDKKKKYKLLDEKAYNSAILGIIFTVIATIHGSIWSKISWGSYWNWDPRETTITILLLIYIAYFSLYSALGKSGNRGKISSAYLIFTMITMPFFVFIIPRLYPSLHPDPIINPDKKLRMVLEMRLTLLVSVISFSLLYFYLLNLMNRISLINHVIKEKYDDL